MSVPAKNNSQADLPAKSDKQPVNKRMDDDLRLMMRMSPDFSRTVNDIANALFSNVTIVWPGNSDPGPLETRALLVDIYQQLCTHGIAGKALVIAPNRDPTKNRLHAPHLASFQRFRGYFFFNSPFDVYWDEEDESVVLTNKAIFTHQLPIQVQPLEETIEPVSWAFDGWLTTYLDSEMQMQSMSNSAFHSFIRSSEGFLRRRLDVPELMKGMPESRLARDVENFLAETQELRGQIVLPKEYAAQSSFAKSVTASNPPNMKCWPYKNIVPPGMVEEVVMPSQISTALLADNKRERYTAIIESHIHAAAYIRQVIETAIVYFYNEFLRKDRYDYYVMLEARRQAESICNYVEKKIAFSEVSYWLLLPNVPANNEPALMQALNEPSASSELISGNSMNPYLEQQTTSLTRKKRMRAMPPRNTKKLTLPNDDDNEDQNIRCSPILAAAYAPFIVKTPDVHRAAGEVPTFTWGAVKNILPEEENGYKRNTKPGTSTTSVVH